MISRAEVNSQLHGTSSHPIISAEYVIAHAARQAQRGKAPSVAFLGHKNPEKALEAATKVQEIGKTAVDPVIRMMKSEFALSQYGRTDNMNSRHEWGKI